jgi:hypothetical protein
MKQQGKVQSISAHKAENISLMGDNAVRPDPEVCEKKSRRRFTAAYKLRILSAYSYENGH